MHGHSNMKPGEFASPDSFAEAMNGRSKYICVNLDIGHFTAANYDAVAYILSLIHICWRPRRPTKAGGFN